MKYSKLMEAVFYKNTDLIKTLLKQGADCKKKEDGESPYSIAKKRGYDEILKMFNSWLKYKEKEAENTKQ